MLAGFGPSVVPEITDPAKAEQEAEFAILSADVLGARTAAEVLA